MAKVGRPTSYTKEIIDLSLSYVSNDETINYKSHNHAIPSIVGLCRIINRARSTLYEWAKDTDNEFSDILPQLNEFQEFSALDGTLKGDLNAHIGKLVLGKHGYSDKTATEHSGPGGGPIETKTAVFEFIPVDSDD